MSICTSKILSYKKMTYIQSERIIAPQSRWYEIKNKKDRDRNEFEAPLELRSTSALTLRGTEFSQKKKKKEKNLIRVTKMPCSAHVTFRVEASQTNVKTISCRKSSYSCVRTGIIQLMKIAAYRGNSGQNQTRTCCDTGNHSERETCSKKRYAGIIIFRARRAEILHYARKWTSLVIFFKQLSCPVYIRKKRNGFLFFYRETRRSFSPSLLPFSLSPSKHGVWRNWSNVFENIYVFSMWIYFEKSLKRRPTALQNFHRLRYCVAKFKNMPNNFTSRFNLDDFNRWIE